MFIPKNMEKAVRELKALCANAKFAERERLEEATFELCKYKQGDKITYPSANIGMEVLRVRYNGEWEYVGHQLKRDDTTSKYSVKSGIITEYLEV